MREALSSVLLVVGWPFRMLLIGVITVYRRFISPLLGPRCKYYPSCSAYALESIQRHGAAKGVALGSWRLIRCNPFSNGGYDPVPEKHHWLPDVYPDGRPRVPKASAEPTSPTPERA